MQKIILTALLGVISICLSCEQGIKTSIVPLSDSRLQPCYLNNKWGFRDQYGYIIIPPPL